MENEFEINNGYELANAQANNYNGNVNKSFGISADDGMAELAAEFGFDSGTIDNSVELTQNLEGFANCFPDWNLHPPVNFK
ncbi:MAG: hypothetical protein MJ131_04835 [Lachnospiraceae bacterium]|nr:hypothetical protein [Lachnospiraceae bacterium]